jgi:hypothetical protein
MTIITNQFRADTARSFVEDLTFNDYYLFASSTSNTIVIDSSVSKNRFLENTLFGKRIDPDEVFFIIKNYPWQENNIFDQYDDTEELASKRYYTVIYPQNNDTGDYRIYKCLFNNYGARSKVAPNYNVNTPNQIYAMPDGYVWKFMYSLSVIDFEKYNARGYIPITIDANTYTSGVITKNIDQIFVENPTTNRGYEKVSGTVFQVNSISSVVSTVVLEAPTGSFNAIENYYSGYDLYVTNTLSISRLYRVASYVFSTSTGRATLTLEGNVPTDGILVANSTYSLLPRVEIRGDGTGASAITNVTPSGSIRGITMLNAGTGYTSAVAFVPDPFAFDPVTLSSQNERVILRPILSPAGGHASNLVDELSCRNVLLFTELTEFDNSTIPTTNEFASVGVIRNPSFKQFPVPDIFDNRIELALDAHNLAANETVTQVETRPTKVDSDFFEEVRFSAKVHSTSNNIVYLCEYMGAFPNDVDDSGSLYANTDFSDISLDVALPLRSSQGEVLSINTDSNPPYPDDFPIDYPGFKLSPYIQRTGQVYYMTSFASIERTEESREQFKIVLEF